MPPWTSVLAGYSYKNSTDRRHSVLAAAMKQYGRSTLLQAMDAKHAAMRKDAARSTIAHNQRYVRKLTCPSQTPSSSTATRSATRSTCSPPCIRRAKPCCSPVRKASPVPCSPVRKAPCSPVAANTQAEKAAALQKQYAKWDTMDEKRQIGLKQAVRQLPVLPPPIGILRQIAASAALGFVIKQEAPPGDYTFGDLQAAVQHMTVELAHKFGRGELDDAMSDALFDALKGTYKSWAGDKMVGEVKQFLPEKVAVV